MPFPNGPFKFPAFRSVAELREMADAHLTAALPLACSGAWMGDHWLHTFAVVALLARAAD